MPLAEDDPRGPDTRAEAINQSLRTDFAKDLRDW
jgi:hypothetical protein